MKIVLRTTYGLFVLGTQNSVKILFFSLLILDLNLLFYLRTMLKVLYKNSFSPLYTPTPTCPYFLTLPLSHLKTLPLSLWMKYRLLSPLHLLLPLLVFLKSCINLSNSLSPLFHLFFSLYLILSLTFLITLFSSTKPL